VCRGSWGRAQLEALLLDFCGGTSIYRIIVRPRVQKGMIRGKMRVGGGKRVIRGCL